ncbi:MAG: hypothetical protein WCZ43_14290, partial [Proteiniphilum sp.]
LGTNHDTSKFVCDNIARVWNQDLHRQYAQAHTIVILCDGGGSNSSSHRMEQTEKIDDDKLKQISEALGVTEEGLKKFTEETVLYYTNNFYENSHATATNIGNVSTVENINQFSMEQAVKLFEELLKIEREKFEFLKRKKE